MRGIWTNVILGIVGWGNIVGMCLVSSHVGRHGDFGVGDVLTWVVFALVGGAAFGACLRFADRQNGGLGDATPQQTASIKAALRTGTLDPEDTELRSLELAVAAKLHRSRAFLVVVVVCLIASVPVLVFLLDVVQVDNPPTGYRVLLAVSISILVASGVVGLVAMIRRNPALERILAEGHRASQIDAA